MQPVNPFGVVWPVAGGWEVAAVLVLLIIALAIFAAVRHLKAKEQQRINNNQLFLFQVKRKGLSNFQIKILNNMVSYLRLSNPTELMADSSLFESSLSGFLDILPDCREDREGLDSICRDMVMMYEKLYVPVANRKSLGTMNDIEKDQILYFTTESGKTCLGKVTGRSAETITIKLFSNIKKTGELAEEQPVNLYIVRINDAEYSAKTVIKKTENGSVQLAVTDQFVMEREFRHPFINVIIPAAIVKKRRSELETDEEIEGTIFRLNEYECVARVADSLPYDRSYGITFELMDYKFNAAAKIISSRTVEAEKVYYYTMKFEMLTEPAKVILRRFISDHL